MTETNLILVNSPREHEKETDKFHKLLLYVMKLVCYYYVCVPLHEQASGALPPAGYPPTLKELMSQQFLFLCYSAHGNQ